MDAYAELVRRFARIDAIESAAGILGWDASVMMPDGAGEGRGEQLAALRGVAHELTVASEVGDLLARAMEDFSPDIIHAHHPFLLGSTALRLARSFSTPLVFTHHTLYDRYTHYVPGDSAALKRFVTRLSTNYANLCARVFAPSDSTARTLREQIGRAHV